jgi:hypothetical protein
MSINESGSLRLLLAPDLLAAQVLLDVWREACRHIEIAEATDLITPLILRQLPLDQIVLRIVDRKRIRFCLRASRCLFSAISFTWR